MKPARKIFLGGMLAAAVMAVAPSARAQIQTTGEPGSPSATITIDGKQLPPPDPKFVGVIKETAVDSKPYWYLRDSSARSPGSYQDNWHPRFSYYQGRGLLFPS
jgi:hypothetical protein